MKKLVILLLCGILVTFSGCGEGESEAYTKGAKALTEKDYETAVIKFEQAIKQEEHIPEAYRGAGIAWMEKGDCEKAEEYLEKSLQSMKKDNNKFEKDVLYYLAEAQQAQGKTEKAIETYREIINLEKEAEAYFQRGCIYLNIQDKEKAQADFQKALELDNSYERYLSVFEQYHAAKLDADGYTYLEQALQKDAESPEDFYWQGQIYYQQNDYKHAKEVLKRAKEENYTPAVELLGEICLLSGEVKEARSLYEEYKEDPERQAMACNGLALCDIAEEQYDSALEYIAQGLEYQDKEQEENLLFNEIAVYEKKHDFDTAREKAQEFIKKYPENDKMKRELVFLQNR